MDAVVGRDGVERAFESYLRGTDGERIIEMGVSGGIVAHYQRNARALRRRRLSDA